jgi:hypothetical protein
MLTTCGVDSIVFVHGLFGHPYDTWTFQVPKPQVILDVGRRRQTSTVDNVKTSRVAADKAHAWASLVKRILRPPDKHVKGQSSSAEASLSTSQSTHQALSSQPGEIDEESAGVSQEEQRAKKPSGTATNARDIFWPRDLLPVALPQANIYTWGYDVDINHVFQSASQASVFHHAGTLLADIANARMSPIDKSRPLIFVAHSLGGIVVKDALQLSHSEKTYLKEILPATVGICFLGTPHRGSATARMGKIAFEISRIFLQKPATSVLRDLEVNSETLDRIGKSFSQILADGRIKVHSFAEELPTTGIMVVQTFSYSIGDAFETTGTIPSNHSNMTKFSSEKDIGFERVSKVLQRWEAEIQSLSTNGQLF